MSDMRSPSLLLARFEGAPAVPDVVGGVVRLDDDTSYWIITMVAGQATTSRVLECLCLLVLDAHRSILPYTILPYSPPQATLLADGRILDWMGSELPRGHMATLRRLRVILRRSHAAYIEELANAFSGTLSKDIHPLSTDHPLNDSHGTVLSAGQIPIELIQLRF